MKIMKDVHSKRNWYRIYMCVSEAQLNNVHLKQGGWVGKCLKHFRAATRQLL